MALTPTDIALHKRLLRSYEQQVLSAEVQLTAAQRRLETAHLGVINEKEILRAAGEDV